MVRQGYFLIDENTPEDRIVLRIRNKYASQLYEVSVLGAFSNVDYVMSGRLSAKQAVVHMTND